MASAPPLKAEISAPFPNPSNAVARTGFGKLWETLFGVGGLLGSSGDVADARAALGIGPVISFRNRIINGGFNVNQRGVSGSVVLAAGAYGHDRWKAGAGGCSYTFATVGGITTITITAGSLVQVIEGANVEGGTYRVSWLGTAQGRVLAGAYAVSPFAISGVTGGSNVTIEFGTGTLTSVQAEPGTSVTPVERRPLSLERSLCEWYFRTSYSGVPIGSAIAGAGRLLTVSVATGTGSLALPLWLGSMRAPPTITIYNPSTGAAGSLRNETTGVDVPSALIGTAGGFVLITNNAVITASAYHSAHFTANSEI